MNPTSPSTRTAPPADGTRTASPSADPCHPVTGIRVSQLPAETAHRWRERAGIAEHDGGVGRERAEAVAWAEVLGRR